MSPDRRLERASRAVIFPLGGPAGGVDVTDSLVAAIADTLGRAGSGNGVLNRVEAEMHLQALLEAGWRRRI